MSNSPKHRSVRMSEKILREYSLGAEHLPGCNLVTWLPLHEFVATWDLVYSGFILLHLVRRNSGKIVHLLVGCLHFVPGYNDCICMPPSNLRHNTANNCTQGKKNHKNMRCEIFVFCCRCWRFWFCHLAFCSISLSLWVWWLFFFSSMYMCQSKKVILLICGSNVLQQWFS